MFPRIPALLSEIKACTRIINQARNNIAANMKSPWNEYEDDDLTYLIVIPFYFVFSTPGYCLLVALSFLQLVYKWHMENSVSLEKLRLSYETNHCLSPADYSRVYQLCNQLDIRNQHTLTITNLQIELMQKTADLQKLNHQKINKFTFFYADNLDTDIKKTIFNMMDDLEGRPANKSL